MGVDTNGSIFKIVDGTSLGAARLSIDTVGDIGVGTSNAAHRLDVLDTGTGVNPVMRLSSLATGDDTGLLFAGDLNDFTIGVSASGEFVIADSASLGYFQRLVIDQNGNVGIGTNTPSAKLEVCLLYTSPSPRDLSTSRMPSSA